jgi:hypothetical protein
LSAGCRSQRCSTWAARANACAPPPACRTERSEFKHRCNPAPKSALTTHPAALDCRPPYTSRRSRRSIERSDEPWLWTQNGLFRLFLLSWIVFRLHGVVTTAQLLNFRPISRGSQPASRLQPPAFARAHSEAIVLPCRLAHGAGRPTEEVRMASSRVVFFLHTQYK